jgi:hypothetical protein
MPVPPTRSTTPATVSAASLPARRRRARLDRRAFGGERAGEDLRGDVLSRVGGAHHDVAAGGDRARQVVDRHEAALLRLVELPVAVADDVAGGSFHRQRI